MPAFITTPDFLFSLLVALGIAVVITFTQILSTYPGFELQVHQTPATWGLYLVNGIFVTIVLIGAWVANDKIDWWKTGIAVGFGLPVIIQSKFTLTKPLGEKTSFAGSVLGDVSINLSEYYNVYAGVFRREMDAAIELAFQKLWNLIAPRFSAPDGLLKLRGKTDEALDARNLPADERLRHEQYIQGVMTSSKGEDQKKKLLAREVLSLMGRKYLEQLAP